MKLNNVRNKIFASAVAASLAAGMTCVPALAQQCPVKIPAPGTATVSEKLDETGWNDFGIGTDFWVYIADSDTDIKDYPQMGDEGIGSTALMIGAIISGIAYLGMSGYANADGYKPRSVKA